MVRSTVEDAICPACEGRGLTYHAETIELPYLGNSLETMLRCEACGYRHVDFVLLDVRDPTRVMFQIDAADDMMVRVVRSSSGTIRIPELGIEIEPGVASEAFISNVEGILVRVERVLSQLHRDAEEDEARAKIEALQRTLQAMRLGEAEPVTLVIEDPFGNSSILAEGTVIQALTQEEAAALQTGAFVFDQDSVAAAEEMEKGEEEE